MGKKGWSYDYLVEKMQEWDRLIESDTNEEEKKKSEEIRDLYSLLACTVLFQDGEVVEEEKDVRSCLEEINGLSNFFNYPSSVNRTLSKISKKILAMEGIPAVSYSRTVDHEEALSIVGDFIKSEFGLRHFRVYQESFLENRDYLLFDKINDLSAVTIVSTEEKFIQISDTRDIRMVSKVAHEAGHIYRSSVNSYQEKENILGEFESFSYELRLLDWMQKNHIYEEEARTCFLENMRFLENLMIVRYLNQINHFHRMKSPETFEKRIQDLEILPRMKDTSVIDFFDYLYTVLISNYPTYLYSFLATIGQLEEKDYREKYQYVIEHLGKEKPQQLLRKVLGVEPTDLTTYQKYRSYLLSEEKKKEKIR